jgi:hypothetical protein
MHLLPRPSFIEITDASSKSEGFLINRETEIVIDVNAPEKVLLYAELLNKEIKNNLGFSLNITRTRESIDNSIRLSLEDSNKEKSKHDIYSSDIHALSEKYNLSVAPSKNVEISGEDTPGILYGVQTLRQLIREYGAFIPTLKIHDEPALKYRGYSFDVTRGRVPTLESLKKLADLCSFYKLNILQLNVEHSFLFRNESELWRCNTPLEPSEILEFDRYCRDLNIDLVPTLASFGHLYELLKSRTYSEYCELEIDHSEGYSLVNRMRHHTVDVSHEGSFSLISQRIKEYMDLFSSNFFNICADETFDLGKGKNAERAKKEGEKALYIDFLKKLCDLIIENGKTPMYWGDIIVEKPELLKELPASSICMNWEYDPGVKEDNLRKFAETGAENIFVIPGVQSWIHLINNQEDAYLNISKMLKYGYKYKAKGVINTEWGDLGHICHPDFSNIGLIYGASFSWNREILEKEEIDESISLIQYGDRNLHLTKLFTELSKKQPINWWMFVLYKEACQNLLSEKNVSCDIVLNKENAGTVLIKNKEARELIAKLYGLLKESDEATKEIINAYILMAEGGILLGEVGLNLRKHEFNEAYDCMDSWDLAVALEKWYYSYQKLWRSVSKESELMRLGEIFSYYADILRTYKQ